MQKQWDQLPPVPVTVTRPQDAEPQTPNHRQFFPHIAFVRSSVTATKIVVTSSEGVGVVGGAWGLDFKEGRGTLILSSLLLSCHEWTTLAHTILFLTTQL